MSKFFDERDDATLPVNGWPWPWNDSHLTDYSYSFFEGKVYASPFGLEWYEISSGVEKEYFTDEAEFIEHCKNEGLKPRSIEKLRRESLIGSKRENKCSICTHDHHASVVYPDMKKVQNISMGKGSGLMFITLGDPNANS